MLGERLVWLLGPGRRSDRPTMRADNLPGAGPSRAPPLRRSVLETLCDTVGAGIAWRLMLVFGDRALEVPSDSLSPSELSAAIGREPARRLSLRLGGTSIGVPSIWSLGENERIGFLNEYATIVASLPPLPSRMAMPAGAAKSGRADR